MVTNKALKDCGNNLCQNYSITELLVSVSVLSFALNLYFRPVNFYDSHMIFTTAIRVVNDKSSFRLPFSNVVLDDDSARYYPT